MTRDSIERRVSELLVKRLQEKHASDYFAGQLGVTTPQKQSMTDADRDRYQLIDDTLRKIAGAIEGMKL